MLCLYLEAPFAVCRTFTAGWYRPTATFLAPSTVYGLLLNVAGIETRLREEEEGHDGRTSASLMRPGLPTMQLALGVPDVGGDDSYPRVQTVYQQLHNYSVGKGNKVDDPDNPGQKAYQGEIAARRSKGNKPNITTVRREFLSDLKALIVVDGNEQLEERIRLGLAGQLSAGRYGLPFLGDNQFQLDRLEECPWPPSKEQGPAFWYERVSEGGSEEPRPRTVRLTVWIDRADLSRTVSALYAPAGPTLEPPPQAWTQIPPLTTT
jgi:CRISPR-associated protein Cas5t